MKNAIILSFLAILSLGCGIQPVSKDALSSEYVYREVYTGFNIDEECRQKSFYAFMVLSRKKNHSLEEQLADVEAVHAFNKGRGIHMDIADMNERLRIVRDVYRHDYRTQDDVDGLVRGEYSDCVWGKFQQGASR